MGPLRLSSPSLGISNEILTNKTVLLESSANKDVGGIFKQKAHYRPLPADVYSPSIQPSQTGSANYGQQFNPQSSRPSAYQTNNVNQPFSYNASIGESSSFARQNYILAANPQGWLNELGTISPVISVTAPQNLQATT